MNNIHDYGSNSGVYRTFHDELLVALQKSGKSLIEIQSIILPWHDAKSQDMITVGDRQVKIRPFRHTLFASSDSH
jgi:hypothetical protein